jgi:hypothetical protein
MPNMENSDLFVRDFIVNFVWVTNERELTHAWFVGLAGHQRKVDKPGNPPVYRRQYSSSGLRVSGSQVSSNFLEIGAGARRVSNSHPS